MSQAKADANKGAPKTGAPSRAKKDQPKSVDFRGLKLKLPAKLPGTILFDIAEIEAGKDLKGTMEFLRSLVGDGQYEAIRAKVAEDAIPFSDVIDVLEKLVGDILDEGGLGLGE
jgi:hypothetical protein